jgi:hypothetical protein
MTPLWLGDPRKGGEDRAPRNITRSKIPRTSFPAANQYPWCSASWFESVATPAQIRTVYGINVHRVRVLDNFPILNVQV